MRTLKYFAVMLLLLAMSTEAVHAQRFTSKQRYWAFGASLNAVNYFGDIVPKDIKGSFDIGYTRPTLGFYMYRKLAPHIGVKAGLMYGTLRGDDYSSVMRAFGTVESAMEDASARYRLYRNLHFRNRIVEVSGMATLELKGNRGFYFQREDGFNPYLTAGIAITYSNPQARGAINSAAQAETAPWTDLRPLATEADKNYSPIVIALPVGAGVRYKVNNRIDVAFEVAIRFTNTDYLDDVSGRFPNLDSLDAATAALSFRGEEQYTINGDNRFEAPGEGGTVNIVELMNAFYGGNAAAIFAATGERRGNDGTLYEDATQSKAGLFIANDIYVVYGFQFHYALGGGVSCPKFR